MCIINFRLTSVQQLNSSLSLPEENPNETEKVVDGKILHGKTKNLFTPYFNNQSKSDANGKVNDKQNLSMTQFLNNQQQQLKKSEKMSKEKQKFFRYAIFNHESGSKVDSNYLQTEKITKKKHLFALKTLNHASEKKAFVPRSTNATVLSNSTDESLLSDQSSSSSTEKDRRPRFFRVEKDESSHFQKATFGSLIDNDLSDEQEWGFAAEAKKNTIFNDPDTGSNDSSINNSHIYKHRGKHRDKFKNNQLDCLFDGLTHFYQTADINRQKLKQTVKLKNAKNNLAHKSVNTISPSYLTNRTNKKNLIRHDSIHSTIPVKVPRQKLNKLPNFAILSSDDDELQLSPSKMVKQAVNLKKYDLSQGGICMPSNGKFPAAYNKLHLAQFGKKSLSNNSLPNNLIQSSLNVTTLNNNQTGRSDLMPPFNGSEPKFGKRSTLLKTFLHLSKTCTGKRKRETFES